MALRRFLQGVPTVRAGGGVISRRSPEGKTQVLVVHRPRYDDWSFPKGKLEAGETEEECALREVREETGLSCEVTRELAGTSYKDRKGRPKTVRYWQMRVLSGGFQPNSEVDAAQWVGLGEAGRLLSYDHDLVIVEGLMKEEAADAAALLVRHGTAGNRKDWDGNDRLRPLDEKGVKQAQALAHSLSGYPAKHLLSSPYVRCVQTLAPLAERLGLPVTEVEELAEGATAKDVEKLVSGLDGLAILCTHGDVVERIIGADAPNRKGGFWILQRRTDGVMPSRYVPPPEVGG